MSKFNVGQEAFFISYVGDEIRSAIPNSDVVLCDVIADKYTYKNITYYVFENLGFRIPENKLFKTDKEAREWLKTMGG